MKKVIINPVVDGIISTAVGHNVPVFAKKDGTLSGMVVHESEGWILKVGGDGGCSGFHSTRDSCMRSAISIMDCEFFIED